MIRFKDFITEIFDKHVPYKKKGVDGNSHEYEFEHEGGKYSVGIYHHKHDNSGEVDFSKDSGTPDRQRTTYKRTGESPRDSHKVFGTVKHIVQKHAEEHGLKTIKFSGTGEPSRDKLYARMAKKYGGEVSSDSSSMAPAPHYSFKKDH